MIVNSEQIKKMLDGHISEFYSNFSNDTFCDFYSPVIKVVVSSN